MPGLIDTNRPISFLPKAVQSMLKDKPVAPSTLQLKTDHFQASENREVNYQKYRFQFPEARSIVQETKDRLLKSRAVSSINDSALLNSSILSLINLDDKQHASVLAYDIVAAYLFGAEPFSSHGVEQNFDFKEVTIRANQDLSNMELLHSLDALKFHPVDMIESNIIRKLKEMHNCSFEEAAEHYNRLLAENDLIRNPNCFNPTAVRSWGEEQKIFLKKTPIDFELSKDSVDVLHDLFAGHLPRTLIKGVSFMEVPGENSFGTYGFCSEGQAWLDLVAMKNYAKTSQYSLSEVLDLTSVNEAFHACEDLLALDMDKLDEEHCSNAVSLQVAVEPMLSLLMNYDLAESSQYQKSTELLREVFENFGTTRLQKEGFYDECFNAYVNAQDDISASASIRELLPGSALEQEQLLADLHSSLQETFLTDAKKIVKDALKTSSQ